MEDWSSYDYDYFQSEVAAAEGIHLGAKENWLPLVGLVGFKLVGFIFSVVCVCVGESGPGSSQADPLLLAVFYDYIQLMPMVAEANQMSQELNKV